eukprot:CAMPEP_0114313964 /NCGR_PEP_ID=MMETSP0059-20121206/21485_1 /TAXON_ID=36894 /ORGANISM="Pyramimonas parkeae, Strain CCMP726" /LENGTH=378 /DNA_ID=CAMNT_0001438933 /DNA_START=384 /DNA_END=1520 /DNA_ORIENTATION=+
MNAAMVAKHFPGILPATPDLRVYHGYLEVQDAAQQARWFWVRIETSKQGSMHDAKLSSDSELSKMLGMLDPHVLKARLGDSPDMHAYLVELRELVERILRQDAAPAKPAPRMYATLLAELDQLGWNALLDLHPTLTSLRLRATDGAQRTHVLEVDLPAAYPDKPPVFTADLPEPLVLEWQPGWGIKHALEAFHVAVARYQDLWESLEDLDAHAWVQDGDSLPRSATHRRVALGGHASLLLDLDPRAPKQPPTCRFLGAESRVNSLRAKYFERLPRWNADKLLRANLEMVLEMQLPTADTYDLGDISGDCAICYAYQLPMEDGVCVPEHACDNAACGRPYHAPCLREWLRANTATRQSFNTFFGACPYCLHPITVKATD